MFVNTSAFDNFLGVNREIEPEFEDLDIEDEADICLSINTAQCSTECQQQMDSPLRWAKYQEVAWIKCGNRCIDLEAKFYQRTQQRIDYDPWCNPEHLLANLELINLCWE